MYIYYTLGIMLIPALPPFYKWGKWDLEQKLWQWNTSTLVLYLHMTFCISKFLLLAITFNYPIILSQQSHKIKKDTLVDFYFALIYRGGIKNLQNLFKVTWLTLGQARIQIHFSDCFSMILSSRLYKYSKIRNINQYHTRGNVTCRLLFITGL